MVINYRNLIFKKKKKLQEFKYKHPYASLNSNPNLLLSKSQGYTFYKLMNTFLSFIKRNTPLKMVICVSNNCVSAGPGDYMSYFCSQIGIAMYQAMFITIEKCQYIWKLFEVECFQFNLAPVSLIVDRPHFF